MNNSEELERVINGYQAAISLWKLASEQIYSRFSAILTANSIIVVINGWLITQQINPLYKLFYFAFPSAGIVLCIFGFLFIHHGYSVEYDYRKKAYELENCCTTKHIAIHPDKGKSFKWISFAVFGLFCCLYIIIIYLVFNTK